MAGIRGKEMLQIELFQTVTKLAAGLFQYQELSSSQKE